MRIVGFNGTQIRDGTSQRGKKKSCAPPPNQNSEHNIRGPLCPDSIAAYMQAISAHALERFFNRVISILDAKSFFPKHIDALLDSSGIQSTELCEGCGKVSKEKVPLLRHRKGRIRKVMRMFLFRCPSLMYPLHTILASPWLPLKPSDSHSHKDPSIPVSLSQISRSCLILKGTHD